MPNLEEAIRERAYHLWIADGRPEGQADIYWLNAQREIHDISSKLGQQRCSRSAHRHEVGCDEIR